MLLLLLLALWTCLYLYLSRVDEHATKPPADPWAGLECARWAVATTVFGPSHAFSQLLERGACIVVVGDKKTNDSEWLEWAGLHAERVFYLPIDTQASLGYAITDVTPANHFSRKNIGYLFAIQHGAELIYDFDDDNELKLNASVFDALWLGSGVNVSTFSSDHHLFNPYPSFEPSDLDGVSQHAWPRGFPLEFVQDAGTFNVTLTRTDAPIGVFQSLADVDPDVDALYRMTQSLPLWFDREGLILRVPEGVFSPWNAQATVFTRDAFWGLIMPISVTGRVADIWRSYVTERLLWIAGLSVAFTSPWVEQYRNPHNYFVDYLAELDLYSRSNELIGELIRFEPAEDLQAAYLRIMERLVQAGFLDDADLRLARHWVHDLHRMGYTWPARRAGTARMRAPKRTVVVDHREHVGMERVSRAGDTKYTAVSHVESMNDTAQGMKDTAVCVSGQLRTLNMRPDDPNFPPSLHPMRTRFTAADMHNLSVVRAFSFDSVCGADNTSAGRDDPAVSVSFARRFRRVHVDQHEGGRARAARGGPICLRVAHATPARADVLRGDSGGRRAAA